MIGINIRAFARILAAAVMLAMMTGSTHAGQDPEPTYLPDGTWLATGTAPPLKLPFMDTYASLPNQHGWKGTVVCTIAMRAQTLPLGPEGIGIPVTATQTGQGSWMRVEKNVYAFTAWRILTGPDGKAVGWMKFWGAIRPDAPDHFFGEINAAYYTLDLVALPLPVLSAATEGRRLEVEGQ